MPLFIDINSLNYAITVSRVITKGNPEIPGGCACTDLGISCTCYKNRLRDITVSAKEPIVYITHEYLDNGYFSQWYPAPFQVEEIRYFHNEQYMMAKKALLFGDTRTYNKIMKESEPAACKALGKSAANFNQQLWDSCKEEIIYNANYAKFSQNPELKAALLATGDAIIAEASPYDKIWGIGLKANDPDSQNPTKWKGQNLLGKALMRVREELRKDK